ncbi:hypothetical protein MASR2M70_07050 [Bacillota bacterium]
MNNTFNKKICGIILSASLCLSLLLPAEGYAASSFKDIGGHWAEQYIETAVAQGIIKGYTDGSFLPDAKVTRAEYISMLNRALGNTATGSIGFSDVYRDAWYYNDVAKSVTAGFVAGFDDGSFKPGANITRQEAAVMMARIIPSYGYSTNLSRFKDSSNIASWAYDSLSKVSGKGYISGYTDGMIHPTDPLTRAQAAKIISDIVRNETIITTDPLVKKDGTKLSGKIYSNNVTMHKDLGEGSASVENCVILGKLIVQGGGAETITVTNSRVVDAAVNRSAGPVRILAKGETNIANLVCSENFYLQTSGLTGTAFGPGFGAISLTASAKGSLQGNFPRVSIDGSSAELNLASGTITTLDVNSAGRRSSINLESRASISQANVYGESYFLGNGTVSNMQVYAKGVTYETKPSRWTINSGGETPKVSEPRLKVTFDPVEGKTGVYMDTKITITFSTPMRERDGSSITNSEINDIVTIRADSKTGSAVSYSGTINSAKTIMTLTPSSILDSKTKYYVIIKSGTMINENDERNEEAFTYFTTGGSTEKMAVTYSPANGATKVEASRRSFTISFSEGVTRYNGNAIAASDSYLKNSVVLFQAGNSYVSTDNYSVSINSKKTQITIDLESRYNLALNTKYTIGIKASTLKTAAGVDVPASNASWTTAGTPELTAVSTVPYELAADFKATPNVSGTIYTVLVADGAAQPSAAQIKDGKDATGNPAAAVKSASVSASNIATLNITGGSILRDTAYRVYAVLYDGNGNASAIVNAPVRTEPLKLKTLRVIPVAAAVEGADLLAGKFKPDTTTYSVLVDNGTELVRVTADANAGELGFSGDLLINGVKNTADVPIVAGTATVTVEVKEDGKTNIKTYTINVKEKGTAELQSITIDSFPYNPAVDEYQLAANVSVDVKLVISAVEAGATIRIGSDRYNSGTEIERTMPSDALTLPFTILSSDGVTTKDYTIRFIRI